MEPEHVDYWLEKVAFVRDATATVLIRGEISWDVRDLLDKFEELLLREKNDNDCVRRGAEQGQG